MWSHSPTSKNFSGYPHEIAAVTHIKKLCRVEKAVILLQELQENYDKQVTDNRSNVKKAD